MVEAKRNPRAETAKTDGSPVVARALQLLETVAASDRPLTLPELCALLHLPKATTHRLCQQVERAGYVAREPGGRRYTPGERLLRVGFNVLRSGLTAERHQILTTLADAIGETCNFNTLAGQEIIYLDRVEARWPLRLHFEIGSHVPIHCTASGKIMLAAMKPPERRRIIEALGLPPYTPHTITERAEFESELNSIAQQGYSLDREEFLLGMTAIAVPVTASDGAVIAAVACHAPSVRFNIERAKGHLPQLKDAARKLSDTLAR
jgi:DNA-binding IclR family transcriptional regulator